LILYTSVKLDTD